MLHSDRRTDAVLLLSLLLIDPNNRIIIKLAKGLLAHKKAGKWRNTQVSTFSRQKILLNYILSYFSR